MALYLIKREFIKSSKTPFVQATVSIDFYIFDIVWYFH